MKKRLITTLCLIILSGCSQESNENTWQRNIKMKNENQQTAIFAGGCFWCIEAGFEKLNGVHEVISGYTGGDIKNPTYEQVSSGNTEHVEAIEVHYDPVVISYQSLVEFFWRQINPTDNGGQFVDRGEQYRPIIFYHDAKQKEIAEKSRAALEVSGRFNKTITTEILPSEPFYVAEDYHQDYYRKNPIRYKLYHSQSGRNQFLDKIWENQSEKHLIETSTPEPKRYQKPTDEILHSQLTALQYDVTQNDATERAFQNEYWDNKQEGIYVDIVSGEPLFSSQDKFDSGTGWPSFVQPINKDHIIERQDFKLFKSRIEVRSKYGDSHLGHVFSDGQTGLRYCINSAALRFIPKEKLVEEGYGELFSRLTFFEEKR